MSQICYVTFLQLVISIPTLGCDKGPAVAATEPTTPTRNSVTEAGVMNARRFAHTATLLNNGKVLIVGGLAAGQPARPQAEIYDPASNTFIAAARTGAARLDHTATRLPDGKVLIAGGLENGTYLSSAEIYDPATGTFAPAGGMVRARSGHNATPLANGKVLIAGGVGTGWTFLADAELYDPATDTFSPTGGMTTARESHTMTLLANGKVLIAGGHKGRRAEITIYTSCEVYDPATNRFITAGGLTVKRHKHEATRLADGRVLITGGSDERDGAGAYTSAEVYDAATDRFTATGGMKLARYKHQGAAVLLEGGKVLVAGGANRAELYDPAKRDFTLVEGGMGTKRLFSTVTLLADGRALIAGGYDEGMEVSAKAWEYTP